MFDFTQDTKTSNKKEKSFMNIHDKLLSYEKHMLKEIFFRCGPAFFREFSERGEREENIKIIPEFE